MWSPDASRQEALRMLAACSTRPTPERVQAVSGVPAGKNPRKALDQAFAVTESVTIPPDPEGEGFDPDVPRISRREARHILSRRHRNRAWILRSIHAAARRFGIRPAGDPVDAAAGLLSFLCRETSWWEADAFPLEAMGTLENRYGWTYASDAWSLREQLSREAQAVDRAWRTIGGLARRERLLLVLNESTPRDYLTCRLPAWAARFAAPDRGRGVPVLLYTGAKISSSEHRSPLAGRPEGAALQKAVSLARDLGRLAVIVDFSRRRFPRAFLRISRFARQVGWGVRPIGKVRRSAGSDLPGPKSPRGLPRIQGSPTIALLDPWPISDPDIASRITAEARAAFCTPPATKPWQDDRIGARVELEASEDGVYRPVFTPWIVPALGGWMRADHLFQSRLARFVRAVR